MYLIDYGLLVRYVRGLKDENTAIVQNLALEGRACLSISNVISLLQTDGIEEKWAATAHRFQIVKTPAWIDLDADLIRRFPNSYIAAISAMAQGIKLLTESDEVARQFDNAVLTSGFSKVDSEVNISFVDLHTQYLEHFSEFEAAIDSVFRECAFIGGSNNRFIKKFEEDFSHFIGCRHVISCANGTDSLEIILKTLQLNSDDEVIVPALSWISTSEAVSNAGGKVVFADINEEDFTLDPEDFDRKITEKTRAVIPVHLYGQPADMDEVLRIARIHGLFVIEDCAQAHGASYKNKRIGTIGDAGSFSFFPGKNLGAYGDAGCMTTNDDALADKLRMVAIHGQVKKHDHHIEGRNSRMDGVHAAVLSTKLQYLSKWTERRQAIARQYRENLSGMGLMHPVEMDLRMHVYHLYVIRTEKRDYLKSALQNAGVPTGVHYPQALPFLKAYEKFGFRLHDFPIASKVVGEILSLPVYPEMRNDQVEYVCRVITDSIG